MIGPENTWGGTTSPRAPWPVQGVYIEPGLQVLLQYLDGISIVNWLPSPGSIDGFPDRADISPSPFGAAPETRAVRQDY